MHLPSTEPFLAYHAGPSRKYTLPHLSRTLVGEMESRDITVQAAAYRRMATLIEKAGLYKQVRRTGPSIARIACVPVSRNPQTTRSRR